tara:strand:- start:309 stop:497 length:189 start_codon:yes stop_codon:yes gene_type:complete
MKTINNKFNIGDNVNYLDVIYKITDVKYYEDSDDEWGGWFYDIKDNIGIITELQEELLKKIK